MVAMRAESGPLSGKEAEARAKDWGVSPACTPSYGRMEKWAREKWAREKWASAARASVMRGRLGIQEGGPRAKAAEKVGGTASPPEKSGELLCI